MIFRNEVYKSYMNFELTNIPKEMLEWIQDLVSENNCSIEKLEWQSTYNPRVVYEYEPFCSEGFNF